MMKVLSIFDKKAEGYKPCFVTMSIGEAERAFLDACNEPGTDLQKHPEDYQLWLVGEFDQLSGELTDSKQHICNGRYTTGMQTIEQKVEEVTSG